jgi:hypothetical protein
MPSEREENHFIYPTDEALAAAAMATACARKFQPPDVRKRLELAIYYFDEDFDYSSDPSK